MLFASCESLYILNTFIIKSPSMKTVVSLFVFFYLINPFIVRVNAQSSTIQWQHMYGGESGDENNYSLHTKDGGYLIAGNTGSTTGDVTGFMGNSDIWVVKTDSVGTILWEKCYGGWGSDYIAGNDAVKETKDSGYIIAGGTNSVNGDLSPCPTGHICGSIWIIKLNQSGVIQWQKRFGGSALDYANSIQPTFDGGYVFAGFTTSNDGDVSGIHGSSSTGLFQPDMWVVKLDDTGGMQWQKCLGGSSNEVANSIMQTSDSGYIIGGHCMSSDGDVVGHHADSIPNWDNWVVKLNGKGDIDWQKCIGGSSDEDISNIKQTHDGGFIYTAYVGASTDGDYKDFTRTNDLYVFKLDKTGNIRWAKNYGGSKGDFAFEIVPINNAYIAIGGSYSNDGDVKGHHGDTSTQDVWVIKIDTAGNLLWSKSIGGSGRDIGKSIYYLSDSNFVVNAYSESTDGDAKAGMNHGDFDYWLLKTNAAEENTGIAKLSNPALVKVYPTITDGTVHVYLPTEICPVTVFVTDDMGRVLFKKTAQAGSFSFSLTDYSPGLYLLTIQGGNTNCSYKIIRR